MLNAELMENPTKIVPIDSRKSIDAAITKSWSKIAPFWPLKNLIAVNPIAGFEDLRFEEGLTHANAYFQQQEMPVDMQHVNRESINASSSIITTDLL